MAKIEAFKAILSPAFKALNVSAEDQIMAGTCEGDLLIAFKGCAIGFGQERFFIAVLGEDEVESEEGNDNILILLDVFTEKFGAPLPWEEGGSPEWVTGRIDTGTLEIALDLAGCELSEVSTSPVPRIVH